MQWDPRRYLLSAVLNRVSVFTNLDQNQLNFSGTSVSVADLQIDPEKLSSGSFIVDSALIANTLVELGTGGVRISLGGVRVEAAVVNLAPDLGLSVVLEQVEHEAQETAIDSISQSEPQEPQSQAPGFLAQTALSQLRLDVHEIELLLHIGDLDLQIDIGSISLEKGRLEAEDFVLSVASEVIIHLKSLDIAYDFPLTAASLHLDTVNINILPALGTIVEILNVVLAENQGPKDPGAPASIDLALQIDQILIADCPLDGTGQFEYSSSLLALKKVKFSKGMLTLDDIVFPGVTIPSPVLQVAFTDPISIRLPHPTTIEIGVNEIGSAVAFFKELGLVLANLKTPQADEPTLLDIELSDLRIKLGEFTLILFPHKISLEELSLSEILVTCGTDRLVIASPQIELEKKRISVRRITAQLSQDTIDASNAISTAISAYDRPLRQPLVVSTPPPSPTQKSSQSLRLSIDSIVASIFGYTVSTTFIGSFGEAFRAKLRPEIIYENNRINASIQVVFSDMLLVYVNITSGTFNLSPPEPTGETPKETQVAEPPPPPSPFSFPFLIELYIKGTLDLVSPIKTLAVSVSNVLNISLKDDSINVHLPEAQLKIKDLSASIPLAMVGDLHLRGNLTKNQFATTIGSIEASACADSLNAIQRLIQFLQPETKAPEFAIDGPEDLSVFDDIDHSAFTLKVPTVPEHPLQYVENYYPDTRARDSLSAFEDIEVSQVALQIRDDYLLELRSASPKAARRISTRMKLLVKSFTFNLHDGYDFHETRKQLSAAVDRVATISTRIGELALDKTESPIVGDLMFNSVFIGALPARSDANLKNEINSELGSDSLARSEVPKLSLRTSKIKGDLKLYDVESVGDILSEMNLNIQEVMIRDLVPTSKWKALLSYDNSVQGVRKGSMVSLQLEKVVSGTDPELRIKAGILPLRIQIDQDTIEFAMRFFGFQPESGAKSGAELGAELGAESGAELGAESGAESGIPEEDEQAFVASGQSLYPFIQRFEIADIHICLDYLPKKVDYAGLRSGHAAEFVNLFVVERSKVVLRHLVVHGISGYGNLGKSLNNIWTPDVRDHQLVSLLKGLGPLKSVFEVAGGIKKFFVVPVREYKRESGVASGIRRGSTSLAKNTVNELVKLGVRVINGPRKDQENESALID